MNKQSLVIKCAGLSKVKYAKIAHASLLNIQQYLAQYWAKRPPSYWQIRC